MEGEEEMTQKIEEASRAVAEAVKLCKPQVIPIYPITPQTHNAEAMSDLSMTASLMQKLLMSNQNTLQWLLQ